MTDLSPAALGRARQAHRMEFHKDKHTSWAEAFDAAIVAGIRAYLRASVPAQEEVEALCAELEKRKVFSLLDGSERLDPLCQRAAAALRQPASPVAEGWRPISEATDQTAAPWDGVPVLIATNHNWGGPANRIHRAKWTDEVHGSGIFGWAIEDLKHGPYPLRGYTLVTHWMPLPPLPASPQEGI